MATTAREFEPKKYRKERQEGFKKFYERAYYAGQGATLSSLDLEEGDTLPDTATAEIIESYIDHDKKTGHRVARVTAIEFLYE